MTSTKEDTIQSEEENIELFETPEVQEEPEGPHVRGVMALPGLLQQDGGLNGADVVMVQLELMDELLHAWDEYPGLRKGLRKVQKRLNAERRASRLLLTRTARKLRRARAGRDRRDRQNNQLRELINAQAAEIQHLTETVRLHEQSARILSRAAQQREAMRLQTEE